MIAILLVGFLLAAPHAALAHDLNEATALTEQVVQLTKQGRYSEAIPLAQRVVALRERGLRRTHNKVIPSSREARTI